MNINAIDLLDWLATEGRPSAATVADCLRIGIPALDELELPAAATHLFAEEAKALREHLPEGATIDFTNFAETLCKVGHRVYLEEPDNIPDWATIVDRITGPGARPREWDFSRDRDRYIDAPWGSRVEPWNSRKGPAIIRQFLDSGRGPTYAREMIERALAAKVGPDMFGYAPRITPPVFTELIEAGINDCVTLWAFEQAGCTLTEAIAMASDGLDGGAVWAAHLSGILRTEWMKLRGMPARWFAFHDSYRGEYTPLERGILAWGFTWDQIFDLNANGWGEEFTDYVFRHHIRNATADFIVRASRVCSLKELMAYKEALETGSGNENRGMPPLTWNLSLDQLLELIGKLKAAGVSASGLGAYRAAGCRTAAEVLQAAGLGITAAVAKQLVKSHGTRENKWNPQRIGSFRHLVRAFGDTSNV